MHLLTWGEATLLLLFLLLQPENKSTVSYRLVLVKLPQQLALSALCHSQSCGYAFDLPEEDKLPCVFWWLGHCKPTTTKTFGGIFVTRLMATSGHLRWCSYTIAWPNSPAGANGIEVWLCTVVPLLATP